MPDGAPVPRELRGGHRPIATTIPKYTVAGGEAMVGKERGSGIALSCVRIVSKRSIGWKGFLPQDGGVARLLSDDALSSGFTVLHRNVCLVDDVKLLHHQRLQLAAIVLQ